MLKKFKFVLLLVLVLMPGIVFADQYQSLYQYAQSYTYTDAQGSIVTQNRQGFHDLYNFDDPIVRCRALSPCGYQQEYYTSIPEIIKDIRKFKIYLAPGTNSINLSVMLNQPSYFAVVARFGTPPGDYQNYLNTVGVGFYTLPANGFSATQLKQKDCIGRSASGIMNVITDGNCNVSEGGWIYILLLSKSGSMYSIQYSSTVNTDPFMSWFRQSGWDSVGDPGTGTSPPPTPVPSPTPIPTPIVTPSPTPPVTEITIVPGQLYKFIVR